MTDETSMEWNEKMDIGKDDLVNPKRSPPHPLSSPTDKRQRVTSSSGLLSHHHNLTDSNIMLQDSSVSPPLPCVSVDRDKHTDHDHRALDAYISNAFNGIPQPCWPAILSYITLVDRRLVLLRPDDAQGLLESTPAIRVMLQKAWDEGTFKDIRKLEILWPELSAEDKIAKHSVKDASTLPRVSFHRDKLTDAEEKDMDNTILDNLEDITNLKWPVLLANITIEDNRLVNLPSAAAKELLQSYPEIEGMLRDAWNARRFKEIRKLEILWPEESPKIPHDGHGVDENVISSVRKAFESSDFIGDANFLCDAVRDVFSISNERRYSNSFSIIQSSGTGKSRLVDEMAKTLFTFPLCVRGDDPPNQLSYPPPDKSVREFLKTFAKGRKEERKTAAFCLLYGLFTYASKVLGPTQPQVSIETVAANWRSYLKDNRRIVYNQAVNLANDLINMSPDEAQGYTEKAYSQLLRQLVELVPGNQGLGTFDPSVSPIVIYLDEAHGIGALDGITSALGNLKTAAIVVIYLSTTSRIHDLAPFPHIINPGRASGTATHLIPFTELCLDPFAHKFFVGKSSDLSLKKVRSIRVAASLGRPMWYAQLLSNYPIPLLLSFAEAKLTGSSDPKIISDSGQRALLSSRLLIHKTENQAGRNLSSKLVASHLGFAYMPSPDQSILYSGYPPEPFVSAAAIRRMPSDYMSWVSWLKKMIVSDYVPKGDRGELISRVLLAIARDLAHKEEQERIKARNRGQPSNLTPDSPLPGHEPVPVCDFLKKFVGEENWEVVANSMPTNMAPDHPKSKTLKAFLGDRAVVDFSCFGIAKDNVIFTYEGMVQAVCQGAAVVCKPHQRDYDSVIVFLLDRDKGFTNGNLGRIVVQDKNTVKRQNPVLHPAKLPGGKIFPTISILHQPAQPRNVKVKRQPTKQTAAVTTPPIYEIDVDGTPLLSKKDVEELLLADDPLDCHRRGSKLASKSHNIVEDNRYYTVSEERPTNAFDKNIRYA